MKKVSIPCAHCGSMFTVSIPTSGVSSMGHQHSPGCMKKTNVYVNNGDITKTTKASERREGSLINLSQLNASEEMLKFTR